MICPCIAHKRPSQGLFRINPLAGRLLLLSFLCVALVSAPSPAWAVEGKELFKCGKAALDAGRVDDAITALTAAVVEFPLLGDYALLYLSDAYHQAGQHDKALEAARRLTEKHPGSPLVRKARGQEMREAREAGENQGKLFEAYLRDYPDDDDVRLMYGLYLRQVEEKKKADDMFKALCVKAGATSSQACAALGPAALGASDLLERASNLMKRYEFKAAERELRKALALAEEKLHPEIMRKLGHALFRQKAYREAADFFGKADDLYYRAKSLYRSGSQQELEVSLESLMQRNDQRAAELLLAMAADKRRDGRFSEALASFRDILKRYPSASEDALWGAGWTAYRSGDYREAADTFGKLYRAHEDPKYLYWQARSLEQLGDSAEGLYASLAKTENNYYSALAGQRRMKELASSVQVEPATASPEGQKRNERIEALQSLGMVREAVTELNIIAQRLESPGALYYVIAKFHELGEYRRSVRLASRLPSSEKIHRYSYPLAFWEDVEKAARRHQVDPFLALAVMREESRFDPDARSVAGARGLMQLMPDTAFRLDRNVKLGIEKNSELHDARTNIRLGVFYLRSLLHEFNGLSHALAAYNAGETAVRKWEKQSPCHSGDEFIEEIPYAETRNYVKKVLHSYFQYRKKIPPSPADAGILGKL